MSLPSAPFNPAKSLFNGLSVIQLKLSPALSSVTATATTDTFGKTAHGLVAGQGVIFVSGTGVAGLVAGTTYYVQAVDANSFKLTAASGATAAVDITTDGTAIVLQPVLVFEAEKLEDDPQHDAKPLMRADATGVTRPVRIVRTKGAEKWTFDLIELKRLLEISGGPLNFRKTGTATLWIPDVTDPSGTVALKSEADFAVSVSRGEKITYGGGDFSKTTIVLESLKAGDVTWSIDAAA